MDAADQRDALLRGVGRVIVSSARYEHALRTSLAGLSNAHDLWWLWQGQTNEWLEQALRTLLVEMDPWQERWTEDEHKSVLDVLARGGRLAASRSAVAHGVWSRRSQQEEGLSDETPQPPPWRSGRPSGSAWYALRSRRRRALEEYEFTLEDLDRLGAEFMSAARELEAAVAALTSKRRGPAS